MVDGLLDWMEDTGAARKLALLLLLAVFASLLAFQFVVAPQQQRARAFQQTLQSLDRRLAGAERPGESPESLRDEINGLARQVESQKSSLGIRVPMDRLLPDIVDTAQSVGVTLTSWQPEEPAPVVEMTLRRVRLRLEAEGRYHALASFLDGLRALPKALIVRSLDYRVRTDTDATDSEIDIRASFELMGFQAAAGPAGRGVSAPTVVAG